MSDNNNNESIEDYMLNQDKLIDVPDYSNPANEAETFAALMNPGGKTSFDKVQEYDIEQNAFITRAKSSGFQEINTKDLTNSILVGETLDFTHHSLLLLHELEEAELEYGINFKKRIRFHRNLLMTILSTTKSIQGSLLNAITTKESRVVQENRNVVVDETQANSQGVRGKKTDILGTLRGWANKMPE